MPPWHRRRRGRSARSDSRADPSLLLERSDHRVHQLRGHDRVVDPGAVLDTGADALGQAVCLDDLEVVVAHRGTGSRLELTEVTVGRGDQSRLPRRVLEILVEARAEL